MKKILTLSLFALTAGCMAEERPEMRAAAESEIAAALAGWAPAGPPQRCVSQRDLGDNGSIGQSAILFRARISNDLVYVNRPPSGCPRMGIGDALRVRTTQTQLCSGDIVEVFDPTTNIGSGGCGLGEFTPYRRTR